MRKYGWRPDLPSIHDTLICHPYPAAKPLPPSADLRANCPPIWDQGDEGSCTGHAIAGLIGVELVEELKYVVEPSPAFIYYNERRIEGDTASDNGAQIRDGMRALSKWGWCGVDICPYVVGEYATAPTAAAYTAAGTHLIRAYGRVNQTLYSLKMTLASKHAVVFGFTVYDSFESEAVASTGIVPMPKPGESVLGGHAVLLVGYDDASQTFLVRNSWGRGWGQHGYFQMPYAYVTNPNLADDLWTITAA